MIKENRESPQGDLWHSEFLLRKVITTEGNRRLLWGFVIGIINAMRIFIRF